LAIEPTAAREIAFAPSAAWARVGWVEVASVDTAVEVRPATPIAFTLAEYGSLAIEVFDREGRRIRTLGSGLWAPGTHRLAWQHDNENGQRVLNDVYEIRLRSESHDAALAR
jgi:hypothetical protein